MIVADVKRTGEERGNVLAFTFVTVLTYFAAPVLYVGVVQAALCAKLGANATVANLPAAAFILGGVAPLLVSSQVSLRYERMAAMAAMLTCSALLGAMSLALLLPLGNNAKIGLVIVTSSLTGVLGLVQQTYVMQCLKRGTSLRGRARALKIAFAIGPVAAVLGSLLAQFLLSTPQIRAGSLAPFAILYGIGVPCLMISALVMSRMRLSEAGELSKPPLALYLRQASRAVLRYSPLLLICIIGAVHNIGLSVMPNLALYATERTGRAPEELVGYMMAVRFAAKSVAGGLVGMLAERSGTPAAMILLDLCLMAAVAVGFAATGMIYLAAFAFIGAAELAGVYHPNYCLSISRDETGARNLSILMIAFSLSSVGSAIHGFLTDRISFRASFVFAMICGVASLALVLRLPKEDAAVEPPNL